MWDDDDSDLIDEDPPVEDVGIEVLYKGRQMELEAVIAYGKRQNVAVPNAGLARFLTALERLKHRK